MNPSRFAPLWLIIAVAVVIGVRQISKVAGSVLGIGVAIGMGAWGLRVFAAGGQVAVGPLVLSRPTFMIVVGMWLTVEGLLLRQALRHRQDD